MIKYTAEQSINSMNLITVLADGLIIAEFWDTEKFGPGLTLAEEYIAFKQEQQRYKGIERRIQDRRLPSILREQAS